ncbi:MAG: hypothetical protein KA498_10115 [Neisseriaceae bacterium]|nr:hypothetical protein [Neisseriaceae bacterium]
MRHHVGIGFICMGLAACGSTSGPGLNQEYQATDDARVRLFGQNGKPSVMTVTVGEEGQLRRIKVNVGGGVGEAFGSMLGLVDHHSIGMAPTLNTQSVRQMSGILSKAFYKEFIVPANRAVTVNNAFIGLSNSHNDRVTGVRTVTRQASCRSPEVTFTPLAGRDYEVATYADGQRCVVEVFELQAVGDDGLASLVPVLTQ